MRPWTRLLVPLGALLLAGCVSMPGGSDVVTTRIHVTTAAGAASAVRHAPAIRAPRGVVVFVHGFLRGPGRHAALAARLARGGFVVVLPDLPSPLADGAGERDAVLVDAWVRAEASPQIGSASGHAPLPLFLGGFSRGSGIALAVAGRLQASERARLAGVLLIDPVTPARLVKPLGVPVALIAAPAAGCNARGMSIAPIRSVLQPAVDVIVPDANHCEPESPSDILCALLCGAPDPGRQARFEDAMVGFILAHSR